MKALKGLSQTFACNRDLYNICWFRLIYEKGVNPKSIVYSYYDY